MTTPPRDTVDPVAVVRALNLGQRQDSTTDQLRTVHELAVHTGCRDAADAIRRQFPDVFDLATVEANRRARRDREGHPS